MTVRHLQNVQRNQMVMEMTRDPTVVNKFRAGFTECATEVSRYVNKIDGVDGSTKQRLLNHLSSCVSNINVVTTGASSAPFPAGVAFPGMIPTGPTGANGQPLQVHIPMSSALAASLYGSADGAVNLSTGSDLNNNRRGALPESKLTTPPPSGSSQFSFQFPPSSTHSPSTPNTPSTPRGLSIAVSPSAYPGPSSISSGYNSFSFPSPHRYQPYGRRDNLGSVSPCSRSSLGSLSPAGSDSSSDLDMVDPKQESKDAEDVWRPW